MDHPVPHGNNIKKSCKSNHKILWCVDISTAKEDRIIYRGWQLELFLYSMVHKGGVPQEDICVTCYVTDLDEPDIPDYYNKIFALFPKVRVVLEIDIGFSPIYQTMDRGPETYCAINKAAALIPVYKNSIHINYDMIALLDLDCYMYGNAAWDRYPTTTTLTYYSCLDTKTFCKLTSGLQGQEAEQNNFIDIWGNPWCGIDAIDLMRSIRVPEANIQKIKPGSYNVFIHTDDFTEELVFGFQYFTIALKSLIAAMGHPFIWQAEMGAYPLALASYGVDYDISDDVEINDCPFHRHVVPEGTLCTYAFDGISQSSGSSWNKMNYMYSVPFDDWVMIDRGLKESSGPAERALYEYLREVSTKHQIERKI